MFGHSGFSCAILFLIGVTVFADSHDYRRQYIDAAWSEDSTKLVKISFHPDREFSSRYLARLYDVGSSGSINHRDSLFLSAPPNTALFVTNNGRHLLLERLFTPDNDPTRTLAGWGAVQLYEFGKGLIAGFDPNELTYYEYGQYSISEGSVNDWGRVLGFSDDEQIGLLEFHKRNQWENPNRPNFAIDTVKLELSTGRILWPDLKAAPLSTNAPAVVWEHVYDDDSLRFGSTELLYESTDQGCIQVVRVSSQQNKFSTRFLHHTDTGSFVLQGDPQSYSGRARQWSLPYEDGVITYSLARQVENQGGKVGLSADDMAFERQFIVRGSEGNIEKTYGISKWKGEAPLCTADSGLLLISYDFRDRHRCSIELHRFGLPFWTELWTASLFAFGSHSNSAKATELTNGSFAVVGYDHVLPRDAIPPESDPRLDIMKAAAGLPVKPGDPGERRMLRVAVVTDSGSTMFTRTIWLRGWDKPNAVIPTEDGFYVVGSSAVCTQELRDTYGFESPWPRFQWDWEGENRDAFVAKFTMDGDTLWTKYVGGGAFDEAIHAAVSENGGLTVVGNTFSFGAGRSDAFVFELDPEGELQWSITLGDDLNDQGEYVLRTDDGSRFVACKSQSRLSRYHDGRLVKLRHP